jgi:hypothetical protein
MFSYTCIRSPSTHVQLYLYMQSKYTCSVIPVYAVQVHMFRYTCICNPSTHVQLYLYMQSNYTCSAIPVYAVQVHMFSYTCIRSPSTHVQLHLYMQSIWNPNSNTLEPDRPQYDGPAVCVIAQQYFSTTFVSLCFHIRRKILGLFSKMYLVKFFILKNCLRLKLRKSESVCKTNYTTSAFITATLHNSRPNHNRNKKRLARVSIRIHRDHDKTCGNGVLKHFSILVFRHHRTDL